MAKLLEKKDTVRRHFCRCLLENFGKKTQNASLKRSCYIYTLFE